MTALCVLYKGGNKREAERRTEWESALNSYRLRERDASQDRNKSNTSSNMLHLFQISTFLFLIIITSLGFFSSQFFVFFSLILSYCLPHFYSLPHFQRLACGYVVMWRWKLMAGGCSVGALEESICDQVVVVWSDDTDQPAVVVVVVVVLVVVLLPSGTWDKNRKRGLHKTSAQIPMAA